MGKLSICNVGMGSVFLSPLQIFCCLGISEKTIISVLNYFGASFQKLTV